MSERKHNPYLILGVPFGVTKREASRAFAKASRRLRRMADAPFEIEDLNAALHAIEHDLEDPHESIDHYRMPADPSVYEIPAAVGRLNPAPQPMARQTPPTPPGEIEAVKARAIVEAAVRLRRTVETSPLPTLHSFDTKG
ncbi:hypothetical protein [Demequina pelophila]|uniref:hypothetical protein n=1 Tax=Demequina pelophila TaxID=1638984 RepID=UPI00078612C2|nr:hypothetical protein [Demequina pelophila]